MINYLKALRINQSLVFHCISETNKIPKAFSLVSRLSNWLTQNRMRIKQMYSNNNKESLRIHLVHPLRQNVFRKRSGFWISKLVTKGTTEGVRLKRFSKIVVESLTFKDLKHILKKIHLKKNKFIEHFSLVLTKPQFQGLAILIFHLFVNSKIRNTMIKKNQHIKNIKNIFTCTIMIIIRARQIQYLRALIFVHVKWFCVHVRGRKIMYA